MFRCHESDKLLIIRHVKFLSKRLSGIKASIEGRAMMEKWPVTHLPYANLSQGNNMLKAAAPKQKI